jgi:hypothetical protein
MKVTDIILPEVLKGLVWLLLQHDQSLWRRASNEAGAHGAESSRRGLKELFPIDLAQKGTFYLVENLNGYVRRHRAPLLRLPDDTKVLLVGRH